MINRDIFSPFGRGEDKLKIGIVSLGCPRNLVDSENILGRLSLKGYSVVDIDKADAAIVNTCCFIEDAKKESIAAVLDLIDLKKDGRLKKIIVCGCLTERYKDKLQKELPEIDAFVGKISFPARQIIKMKRDPQPWTGENQNLEEFILTPKHYTYVKICEGCINNCSFCIIPKIKGKLSSMDMDSILSKVEKLDQNKLSELNIIGQDITGYGLDLYAKIRLTDLLHKVIQKTKNIRWVRLLYLYPSRINDALLELVRNSPKLCKYIDLPIQHINGRILKLMHRQTSKKYILGLLDKIRKKIPEAAIRTSFIVGFSSETDREFKELLKFSEEMRFERLGAFIYSREEGTQAYNLKKQLPHKVKLERFNRLMLQQQKISQDINKNFLGKVMEVLIDEREKDGAYASMAQNPAINGRDKYNAPLSINPGRPVASVVLSKRSASKGKAEPSRRIYLGRTQYDAPEVDGLVYVESEKELKPGDFLKVRITGTLEYDLVGEAILT